LRSKLPLFCLKETKTRENGGFLLITSSLSEEFIFTETTSEAESMVFAEGKISAEN